ncbi:MAG TPA: phosphate ABC transporter permease subunit PstC [Elusimicrobia bacterium]|jgi:phosphate transport system permease protein|nr:phosphate ABC transporter permease subunit PstC [Elusimicrobiota bacterium]
MKKIIHFRVKPRIKEWIIETLIRSSAVIVIVSLILIFLFVGKETLPIFFSSEIKQEVNLNRLFLPQARQNEKFVWQPISTVPKYSIIPLIIGTLKTTIIALLFALPLAIGAAIFTSEFAPTWLRELIKPAIELLAGVPSVVLGFFGLIVLATWLQNIFSWTFRLNAITAGIALGLAILPVVYTVTEDALSAVPNSYREGSLALGANVWQTAWGVVLPAALPGIFAACVLGFGRAFGETMIVLMASGNAAITSLKFTDSVRTLSATIATELAEVVVGSAHYYTLFFIGTFLFVFTFINNILGQWFVQRLRKRLHGET